MKQLKILTFLTVLSFALYTNRVEAQQTVAANSSLSMQEQSIIAISVFTSTGELDKLKRALQKGLENKLTVNEIKEVLIHSYAYCGFPRSIRGLQTFMEVLNERKAQGTDDKIGIEASKIDETNSKYERGKKILGDLLKIPQPDTLAGYSAFAPTIDIFLKEHLFADIFERDILTYVQRELVTISAIAGIGKAAPMLKSHLTICLNLGLTPEQLRQYVGVLKSTLGKKEAKSVQKILAEVLKNRKS